jgi:GMP synthase (glutamine-hydrolysing)
LKTLLVNNYLTKPTKINRLQKEICGITEENPKVLHVSNVEGFNVEKFNAVVLSGGEAPLNWPEVTNTYSKVASWIREIRKPILGICFGHQLLGFAFGGRIARFNRNFEGYQEIKILNHDNIFCDLPNRIKVYKSNKRIVVKVMRGFELLAKGSEYEVEAFKHKKNKVFGVQFHPEYYSEDYSHGKKILENFFEAL